MAKKITFAMLVLLIVSAFVFVSCTQEAGGKPTPPKQKDPVVNELGDVGPDTGMDTSFADRSQLPAVADLKALDSLMLLQTPF